MIRTSKGQFAGSRYLALSLVFGIAIAPAFSEELPIYLPGKTSESGIQPVSLEDADIIQDTTAVPYQPMTPTSSLLNESKPDKKAAKEAKKQLEQQKNQQKKAGETLAKQAAKAEQAKATPTLKTSKAPVQKTPVSAFPPAAEANLTVYPIQSNKPTAQALGPEATPSLEPLSQTVNTNPAPIQPIASPMAANTTPSPSPLANTTGTEPEELQSIHLRPATHNNSAPQKQTSNASPNKSIKTYTIIIGEGPGGRPGVFIQPPTRELPKNATIKPIAVGTPFQRIDVTDRDALALQLDDNTTKSGSNNKPLPNSPLVPASHVTAPGQPSLEPVKSGFQNTSTTPASPTLQPLNFNAPELEVISPSAPSQPITQPENKTTASTEEGTAKKKKEKPPKSVVYYTPLPAIAVIPVIKTGTAHTFHDTPLVFAKAFSLRLEEQAKGTKVLNPYYMIQAVKDKGLETSFNRIMKDYIMSGRPDPIAFDFFLKRLNGTSDTPIARVFFVEADFDINDPTSPKGLGGVTDRIRNAFDGSMPTNHKYFVRSNIQAFDTEDPSMPRIWSFKSQSPVRQDRFNNVTTSIYSDADSLRVFSDASLVLTREAFTILPKAAYMDEQVDTSVQGRLAKDAQTESQTPGMTSEEPGLRTSEGEEGMNIRKPKSKPRQAPTESSKKFINKIMN